MRSKSADCDPFPENAFCAERERMSIVTQCSSIIAGSTMLAALPFLLCYSGFDRGIMPRDLRHGLLPDRYTCPLLWSGLLFISVWRRTSCMMPSGGDSGLSLWLRFIGYTAVSAAMKVGLWRYKISCRPRRGMAGDCCRSWSGCLATRRHSVGRSRFIRQLRQEEQMGRSNPLPFGPFTAAAGFGAGGRRWLV